MRQATTRKLVLIMTDMQSVDVVGCYGNRDMKTPSIDRLAAEGIMFDRAYTTQPVCGPARSAIFTGMYPHANGSWANSMPMSQNVLTIGQRLRKDGLHTAYIGKWHLDGGDYFGWGKCPDGWDERYWYDMRRYLEELPEEDRRWSRTPRIMEQRQVDESFTFAHRCSDRAIDFLSRHGDEGFLLVVSYDEPHDPCICPEPFASMYRDYEFPKKPNVWDTLSDKPEHHRLWAGPSRGRNKEETSITPHYMLGCNSFVDYEIGRVADAIDSYAPDALVLYTSDHGAMLNSHCLSTKGPAMYDEITKVPFIVRWPGVSPKGVTCSHPVSHIDIAPTLMDAATARIPRIFGGRSLLPTLRDPSIRVNERIFIEFGRFEIGHDSRGGFQPIRSVFDGRFKLCINLLGTDELYALDEDPYEMKNLIDSPRHAGTRDRLHDHLLRWMDATLDPFRGYCWERRPWRKDTRDIHWYGGGTRHRATEEHEPSFLDYRTGMAVSQEGE